MRKDNILRLDCDKLDDYFLGLVLLLLHFLRLTFYIVPYGGYCTLHRQLLVFDFTKENDHLTAQLSERQFRCASSFTLLLGFYQICLDKSVLFLDLDNRRYETIS